MVVVFQLIFIRLKKYRLLKLCSPNYMLVENSIKIPINFLVACMVLAFQLLTRFQNGPKSRCSRKVTSIFKNFIAENQLNRSKLSVQLINVAPWYTSSQ